MPQIVCHLIIDNNTVETCTLRPGPNLIELLSTKICLALNFCLDKNWITHKIFTWFSWWANISWIPVTSKMQQMEIWLVILFLSRKKCHAKQIVVLSSAMKLSPDALLFLNGQGHRGMFSLVKGTSMKKWEHFKGHQVDDREVSSLHTSTSSRALITHAVNINKTTVENGQLAHYVVLSSQQKLVSVEPMNDIK